MTLPAHSYSPRQSAYDRSQYPSRPSSSSSSFNPRIVTAPQMRPGTPLTRADMSQIGVPVPDSHNFSQTGLFSSGDSVVSQGTPFSRVSRLTSSNPNNGGRAMIGHTVIQKDPAELPHYMDPIHNLSSRPGTGNQSERGGGRTPRTPDKANRPNTAAIAAGGGNDALTGPHMVRLTPIGKSYVSYFVREKPFVSYLAEARITSEEEKSLREKAARVEELEEELAELKKMFVQHHEELNETKTKHHLGLWSRALTSHKKSAEEKKKVEEEEAEHQAHKGELHQVFRDNISLRLRLMSAKAVVKKKEDEAVEMVPLASPSSHNIAQFLSKSFGNKAAKSLSVMDDAQSDLDGLHKDIARLDMVTRLVPKPFQVSPSPATLHSVVSKATDSVVPASTSDQHPDYEALLKERDQLADTLKKSMNHIENLTSKLAISEAKAISAKCTVKEQEEQEYADEDEAEQLKQTVKGLMREKEALKKKLKVSTVKNASGAIGRMKRASAKKSSEIIGQDNKDENNDDDYYDHCNSDVESSDYGSDEKKTIEVERVHNDGESAPPKRKIVIVPIFFRPKSSSSSRANSRSTSRENSPRKHSSSPRKHSFSPGKHSKKTVTPTESDSPMIEHHHHHHQSKSSPPETSDESDEDSTDSEEEISGGMKAVLANRHKKEWKRWQIEFSDGSESDDEDDDGGGGMIQHSPESPNASFDGHKVGSSHRHHRRGSTGGRPHKHRRRRKHYSSPIDVSPLVKYLHWHKKDKRVSWDQRRTLKMAHDILRKKAVQEVIDERQGKPKTSVSVFFEDYFFRNFGHLAKYNLRCFVHSLLVHKNQGDRRAELFALVVGLHHPELYSTELSSMFMRLLRGLFRDHTAIKNMLDRYDSSTQSSNVLISRENMWSAILGEDAKRTKPESWQADELIHLTSIKEFRRDVVKRAKNLPVHGIDTKQMTDIDDIMKLIIEFYVEGAIRMQLRLRNFFVDLMSGGATAAAVRAAAMGTPIENDDPHTPVHSTAHQHLTWEDFVGFVKMCQKDSEAMDEDAMMTIFSKFNLTDFEDVVDDEIAVNQVIEEEENMKQVMEDELKKSEAKKEAAKQEELMKLGAWERLRHGGLKKSLGIENIEKNRLLVKITEEAKVLAAICYQNGLYLPFEAGTHGDEMKTKSVNLWTTK